MTNLEKIELVLRNEVTNRGHLDGVFTSTAYHGHPSMFKLRRLKKKKDLTFPGSAEDEAAETSAIPTAIDKRVTPPQCLISSLHATENGGGIGNVMFELLGLISIARQVDR
uniref:Uncharacterized protein n=1 Tax=Angiostrongylus cantonensis TaxID=6313 RepID=A0A0K0CXF9_ANGCA